MSAPNEWGDAPVATMPATNEWGDQPADSTVNEWGDSSVPTQSYLGDKARRFGAAAVRGAGEVVSYAGRLARQSSEFLTNINPLLSDEAKRRINAESQGGTGAIATGGGIKAAAGAIRPDPARDNEIGATVADVAGSLVPAVVASPAGLPAIVATVASQMGENERDRALKTGATEAEADARAKVAAAGGGVLALTPAGPVRGVAGAVERLATRAAVGAAANSAQDAALQKALDDKVDWHRVGFSALFGGGFGFLTALPEAVRVRAEQRLAREAKAAADVDRIVAEELAKAPVEDQHAAKQGLSQLIDDGMGIKPPDEAAQAARRAAAAETLAAGGEPQARAALDPRVADPENYMRWWTENTPDYAGDFQRARAEEAQASLRAQAADLQATLRGRQLAGDESIVLGDDPVANQRTMLETRPGSAARERARLDAPDSSPNNLPRSLGASALPEEQALYLVQRARAAELMPAVDDVSQLRNGLWRYVYDATNPRRLGFTAPGFDRVTELLKKKAPSWFLPQAMRDTLRLGDQATRGILSEGGALQKDLAMSLRSLGDKGLIARQTAAVQAYLTGAQPLTALEASVRGPAQQVRAFIDGLSDRAVREGVVTGELANKFTDNLGTYLRRSYRIHADPDYAPTRQQITTAIDAVQKHNGMPREEAAQLVNDLLEKHNRAAQVDFLVGRGKLAGKDVSSLVRRKDLLPEVRALLGEIHDPVANVGQTIPRLARLIEQHHAQVAMRDVGLQLGVFRDVTQKPLTDADVGKWVPLVSESSATHDVWAGLHALPEIREALQKTAGGGRVDGLRGWVWDAWRTGTGVAKTAKTVLNPDSYAPNLLGGLVNGAANGNFRVHELGRGLKLGLEEAGALRWLQSKGMMPANRAGLQEEVAKLTKLGLRGENLSAADLQQTLDRSLLRPLAEKTIKPLQHVYGGTDDLTKYIAWKSEMARYARAFPQMGREELEQLAANVVRDTMPTYSQVPQALREASQLGLAPTFVNFTYEVFRNTANAARIGARDLRAGMATGNRQLARAGAERLAALTAVLGLSSAWGWSRFSQASNGVSEDQDKAVRFFGPVWNKNGQLVYNSPIGADGKVQFSNMSYMLPQAVLWDAIGEARRAETPSDMASAFAAALGKQFLGVENSLVLDTIIEAKSGVDAEGRRIVNPESPTADMERVQYVFDRAFKPVFLDKLDRMRKAYTGEVSETGRSYSLTEEGKRLGGMRAQTLDANQAAVFKARALGQRFSDATAIYRRELRRNVSPEDLQQAYAKSEQARQRVFQDLRDYYRFGRSLNVSEDALVENLRKASVPAETILGVLDGVYVAGAKEQRETVGEIFAKIRNLPVEKRKAALRDEVLKNPSIVKALAERGKEEAKGLTARDKLVRSLGVGDGERANYIRTRLDAMPDPEAKRLWLVQLARRGILTEGVVQQLSRRPAR